MTSPGGPSASSQAAALPSANADWVRALQRTASVTLASTHTLMAAVTTRALEDPERIALEGEGGALTYGALLVRANLYARWGRAQGLKKGDRVALMLCNQPDYAAIWIGLSSMGVVVALLNTQLVGAGLAHCLAVAECRHVIVGEASIDEVAKLGLDVEIWGHGVDDPRCRSLDRATTALPAASLPDSGDGPVTLRDPGLLIYTSGTTGLPKAAHVSHYRIMMWSEWFAGVMNVTPDDRLFDCLPMYHSVGGVAAVGAMLVAGGAVVIREGFSASRFWPDVVASRATIFQYIGELCRYLAAAPPNDADMRHRLRLCIGNGLRADVWERFAARFAIPRIIEFYAATEGSFSLFNLEGKAGAIGRVPRFMAHRTPVALVEFDPDSEMPVRDANGLCRRCPRDVAGEAIGRIANNEASLAARFEGYTSEAETRRKVLRDVFEPGDAWFRTGDLMRQDAAGFFYFVERIGDTFRWKGENVGTSDVAVALLAYPGIVEAVSYGVPVPNADGKASMAVLVTTDAFDLDALPAHLAARVPSFARPVFLRIRDSIETTGTFRAKKHHLVRDGFDPHRIGDALYVFVPEAAAYRALDQDTFTRIEAGGMRL